jgi:rhamnosyltransferase
VATGRCSIDVSAILVVHDPPSVLSTAAQAKRLFDLGADVVLVDNGGGAAVRDALAAAGVPTASVRYHDCGTNIGQAAALNVGLRLVHSAGHAWAYLLDQDSEVLDDALAVQLAAAEELGERGTVAVVGASPREPAEGPVVRRLLVLPGGTPDIERRRAVITSGSLVDVAICIALGGFDESMFIDEVDHEYCTRARAAGYVVGRTTRPTIDHRIGVPTALTVRGRSLLQSHRHSSMRSYYRTRNSIRLARRHLGDDPILCGWRLGAALTAAARNLALSEDRREVARCLARGITDGFGSQPTPRRAARR